MRGRVGGTGSGVDMVEGRGGVVEEEESSRLEVGSRSSALAQRVEEVGRSKVKTGDQMAEPCSPRHAQSGENRRDLPFL